MFQQIKTHRRESTLATMSRSNAVLFQDAEAWGLASSNPHCLIAQAALKFAGVPYHTSTAPNSFSSSAERPVLTIGDVVLTGAAQIIEHLRSKSAQPLQPNPRS